jgi:outer membrane receptor protein involved in Fe transport
MRALAAALLLLAATAHAQTGTPADTSAARDTTSRRIVRRLEEVIVRASRLADPLSSQSVHRVGRAALRELPVDRLADALALEAGVVAVGEQLHVRGGRAGDSQVLLGGISLGEALRGSPMDVPRLAIESADIVSGGLDAEHGGALAGVIPIRTVNPGERTEGEVRWDGDLGFRTAFFDPTRYNRLSALISAPIARGWGAVASADVATDDTHLPALHPRSEWTSWRADNRLLGFLKIAPVGAAPRVALEILGSRRVTLPYDPMWSLDGYTTACIDPPFCTGGPGYSDSLLPGYERYRAADHQTISDERRWAALLTAWRPLRGGRLRGALGWVSARRLTAVGGRSDESYLDAAHAPLFGLPESPNSDPFFVYVGDEPFFQKSRAETFTLRGDFDAAKPDGNRAGFGAGLTYDRVRMRELDLTTLRTGLDSLRAYDEGAPGGFAYAQGRWVREGLVLNGGLRLEAFTAGPGAEDQSFAEPARTVWTLSPRLGVAYPVSSRDVLSLAYVRIQQAPARDFLYENRRRITHRQPLGNPALEPATAISYQAALKHLFDGGRALQAAIFYRDLYGQVGVRDLDPTLAVSRPRYENADEGHAEGFEIEWIVPHGAGSELDVQYTYLQAVGTQSLEEGRPFGDRFSARTEPTGNYPLDWDRRHSIGLSWMWRKVPEWTFAWSTRLGSGLPWTPSPRRDHLADLGQVNARRFDWDETSSVAIRWGPPFLPTMWHLSFGLDVRNVFDFRGDRLATLSGYPHPLINTYYDDYGAYRDETGLGGGAYWDRRDPDGADFWVRTHDPRLGTPPRAVRFTVAARW